MHKAEVTYEIDKNIRHSLKSRGQKSAQQMQALAREVFGRSLASALVHRQCVSCMEKCLKDSFRTLLSYREYMHDGLCQVCQDEIWAPV
jgi:hypothetical protein